MPLVSLCGFPCSGKSTRAAELKEFISKNHPSLSCKIITDDGNSDEKKLRVERELTATTVLILDSSNFIKGFRYQLYCIAKQNSTPHCLLYTACPATLSKTRNESRETPYSDFVMEDLITRFEEPDFKSRWDMPMFTILPDDDISLVGNEIIGVCLKKSVKQSRATFKPIVCGEGYAMLLDKRTSDVVQSVIAAKNQGQIGRFKIETTDKVFLEMPDRHVGMPEVMRLRRQFIAVNSVNVTEAEHVRDRFLEYLNAQFEE